MFGIDLGVTISSVTLIAGEEYNGKILDSLVIYGHKGGKNYWKRAVNMSEAICTTVDEITKSRTEFIDALVSIEEPVYPYRTRNPQSYFTMCCLYALVRKKLATRGYDIHSINPMAVKSTAKALAFKGKRLKEKYAKRGRLTKTGMIRAFKKVTGSEPVFKNKLGRETLADSFFIARTGLDRRRVGLR